MPPIMGLPARDEVWKRTYEVKVPPPDQRSRTHFYTTIHGRKHRVDIPPGTKTGEKVMFTVYEEEAKNKVITSTLPTVPGFTILMAKPIIFGSVSFMYTASKLDEEDSGQHVAPLMEEAQERMIEQVIEAGGNACLSMSFNVTIDSREYVKYVIVTAYGTPCYVVPNGAEPCIVIPSTEVRPLNNY